MSLSNQVKRLEQILHSNRINGDRSQEQCDLLSVAAVAMETHRVRLKIPEKDIKIIRYLASNPRAVLVKEPNVLGAFRSAKEAKLYGQ